MILSLGSMHQWQQIVQSFHKHIPLKRHRYHLKTYEYCFTGREMINWLHNYLTYNPNFGSDVSRQQAVLVACKFLNQEVVLPVRSGSALHFDEASIHDDHTLYRLNRSHYDSTYGTIARKKKMSRDVAVDPIQSYNIIPPSTNHRHDLVQNGTLKSYPLQDVSNQKPSHTINSADNKSTSQYPLKSHRIRATSSCTQQDAPTKKSYISSVIIKRFNKLEKSHPPQVDYEEMPQTSTDRHTTTQTLALPTSSKPSSSQPSSSLSSSSAAQSQPKKYNYEDLVHIHLAKTTLQQIWKSAVIKRLVIELSITTIL